MKFKITLLICSLALAVLSSGCGLSPSASHETVQTDQEPAEVREAKAAYQDILRAAPALEGEHAELADASFDYEQNRDLFGDHYELFALSDLDLDGIPELIAQSTVNFRWTQVSVYTYADGKAVLLKDPLDAAAYGTLEQRSTANGAYLTYFCEAHHIHSLWRGTNPLGEAAEENQAYRLEGTTLTAVDCEAGDGEQADFFSEIAKENTAENVEAMRK